jgi:hypothetical protein
MKLVPNIVPFTGPTRHNTETKSVLESALAIELEECVVIGVDKTGELYFASSMADGGSVLWWMAKAKKALLEIEC